MTERRQHKQIIPDSEAGKRLDQALAALFPHYSRARLKHFILNGRVRVDGENRRPRDTVFGGEMVELDAEPETQSALQAQPMDLDIAYQDDEVIVVNKPVGLVVHPGAGNADGTLVNGLLALDIALAELPRAGLIHRLDKDTSGLLVVARTRVAFDALTAAMSRREIHREYQALCVGRLTGGGTIDAPIGRHPVDRKRMAVHERGRQARTHFRIERRFRGYTLLRVTLETGRTHQIRVHFAHQRYPLVGDPVYGRPAFPKGADERLLSALQAFRRQALHATRLGFTHPVKHQDVDVSAAMPADFAELLAALAAAEAARGDAHD